MDDKVEALKLAEGIQNICKSFKAGCSHECPFCDKDSIGCILTDLPYKWDENDLKGEG